MEVFAKGSYPTTILLPSKCSVLPKETAKSSSMKLLASVERRDLNSVRGRAAFIAVADITDVIAIITDVAVGGKRALIYEFMSNGSLEKFIYGMISDDDGRVLTVEDLYQITIEIARGLEYLHLGCNTRILHFDIKPHNILLDHEFHLKISDFGLAKLCRGTYTVVSMIEARGTIGYIAPEVFCRNIGSISHKSDVYSYGMMILEMARGRKNLDVGVHEKSEIYFPHWIHQILEQGNIEPELLGLLNEE
ncbi:putative receptor-like protein kinase [Hibiscus syriacus]|uniref:non-specific serine/threonine protein kinase n=1 Tax=Hibiscus syriacus TaxID=106335 RepID=A0A6A3A313_HIBSY|nr:putative receptor-like protein kinase [Hibiscus syriacus]